MKKSIIVTALAAIITGSAFAQPVSDRAVVPMGVTLVQILRIHVTNGGNIEFVFNDIDDYKTGIANNGFYDTDFTVASSTDWTLHMGAEDATFVGTDNSANTLPLNFVAFLLTESGAYDLAAAAAAGIENITAANYSNSNTIANGLAQYTGVAATDGLITTAAPVGNTNGGDALDNIFTINWQSAIFPAVGVGTEPASAVSMLTQSPAPDRYTTNVFLELEAI